MSKNQRLNATITIGSVLEGSVKRNIGFLKSGLGQIGSAIKDVERRQKELDRQRNVLRRQGKSVDHLDREYDKLGRTLDDLRRKQERWNRAAAASRRVGTTFSAMSADIGRNVRRLAIGAGVAGGAIFGLASSTASTAKEIQNLSKIANTSPDDFQRMAAAAESVGIENDKLGDILKDVNDRIGDFIQTGGGPMADFFENIGPKVGVTIDQFRELSGKDALQLYVTSLQEAGLSQQEMTFYMEAMAGDASLLIPLLQDNGKEMTRLGDKAERSGRILNGKALASAEEFREELTNLHGTFGGLKNIVGTAFMPVVTQAMRQVGDTLVGNRKQVREWSEAFARNVEAAIPVIGDVASGIGKIIKKTNSVITATANMVGGWENFGTIIGGLMLVKTGVSVGKFATAAFSLGRASLALIPILPLMAGGFRAVGTALIANPIGALITAIAVGGTAIYQNWDKIKPVLQPVIDWMGEKFTWLWENAGKPVVDGLKKGAGYIGDGWEKLKEILKPVIDWMGEKFTWLMEKIQPVIDGMNWVMGNKSSVFDGMSDAQINAAGGRATVKQTLGVGGLPASGSQPTDFIGMATPKAKPRALGGAYTPGWLLTGEAGPELKFENRSGYIANNRALRQMAGYASRIGSVMSSGTSGRGGSRVNALLSGGAGGAARPSAGGSIARQVTQNITYTINAAGASAEEVIRIIERKSRAAAGNGLFDRVPSTGLYGR